MKFVIAGSRNITDIKIIYPILDKHKADITEIGDGGATGVDSAGGNYGRLNNIPVVDFPADWNDLSHPDAVIKINKFGKKYDAKSGMRRNERMKDWADAVICIRNPKSAGSEDMVRRAKLKGIPVFEYIINQ